MSFARVLKNLDGIRQWQFIQKDKSKYLLKLNVQKEKFDLENTLLEIRKIVGQDADVQIEYVEDIPVLALGKRKMVICEWKKS